MLTETMYQDYLACLIKGDRTRCAETVTSLLDRRVEIKTLYLELFQKSLYDVGLMWEANKISVAREHLATAITESLLSLIYPELFAKEEKTRSVVISCAVNEFHQVGGKIVADFCEIHGWDAYFLGANTPMEHLLGFIDEVRPDLIGLSLSVYFNLPRLKKEIRAIQSNFSRTDLMVGGQAFALGGEKMLSSVANINYVPGLDELEGILAHG